MQEPQLFSDLLAEVVSSEGHPQRESGFNSKCRSLLTSTFGLQSDSLSSLTVPLGPLSEIHTSSQFAFDQLWQQLELRNKKALPFLKQYVSSTVSKRRRVSFNVPPSPNKEKPSLHEGDKFFNVDDMETFAEEEASEKGPGRAPLEKPSDATDPEDADLYENSDDPENCDTGAASGDGFVYSDFFDDPPSSQMKPDHEFDQDDDDLHSLDFVDDEVSDGDSDGDDVPASDAATTPLQKLLSSQKETISAIEEGNIRPKPWSLRGEVSAFTRPKDSLLNTPLEHDTTARPNSFVSSEISQNIESVIKQRIADGLFDDVVVAAPEHYEASKKRKTVDDLPHVSQEKPSEGLADLYAREYTDKKAEERKRAEASSTVERVEQDEGTEAQKEVNTLLSKLLSRLDTLSRVNFINEPNEKADETLVSKYNVKAIAAEEPVPDAVSDGDMLAPREVFSVNKGELKGSTEMTKEERKAKRQRNKSRGAARRKTQAALDRSNEHFDAVAVDHRKGERVIGRRRIAKVKSYS